MFEAGEGEGLCVDQYRVTTKTRSTRQFGGSFALKSQAMLRNKTYPMFVISLFPFRLIFNYNNGERRSGKVMLSGEAIRFGSVEVEVVW